MKQPDNIIATVYAGMNMFNRSRTIDALARWYRGVADNRDTALLLAYGLIRQNRYTARAGLITYLATAVGVRTIERHYGIKAAT